MFYTPLKVITSITTINKIRLSYFIVYNSHPFRRRTKRQRYIYMFETETKYQRRKTFKTLIELNGFVHPTHIVQLGAKLQRKIFFFK